MPVQNEEILKAITDLSTRVETYHGDFREFRGATNERVTNLEEDFKTAKNWETFKIIGVIPIVTALHYLANRLGMKV